MKTNPINTTLNKMTVVVAFCLYSQSALSLEPLSEMTLKQAIQNTLEKNPELKKYPFDIQYQQALSQQAEIKPLPQLSIQAEDIVGTDDYSLADETQLTLTLSQNYEMGDKLQHRLALSQSKEDSKRLEFELAKLDTVAETSRRFYEIIYLQNLSDLVSENLVKQKSLLQKINRLAQAGVANPVDQSRIHFLIKQSNHQLLAISKQQNLAKVRLSAMWQSDTEINSAMGSFKYSSEIPSKKGLLDQIENSPAQLHYLALQREADYNLKLEKSYGVQDITYSFGIRHKAAEDAQTLNFGISMPLAFGNPNQGRIEAAKIKLQQSQSLQVESTQKLKLEVIEYWYSLQNMQSLLDDIESQLLPESKKLISTSLAAYQRGSTSLLQVMEAQQIWFELKTQQLELHKQRQLTLLELERLIGMQPSAE